jgi:S-formylglutathione hydrolase FrmB
MRHLLAAALLLVPVAAQQPRTDAQPADTKDVVLFEMRSELLSAFWGREIRMQAGVVLPPPKDGPTDGPKDESKDGEPLPVCYSIHGFGGSHKSAWRSGPKLVEDMRQGYPRMLYVFLNAACPLGHHEFADSVNNGPWGKALTTEFAPALEAKFRAGGAPAARFLTGHSSGGWSSLWLQVAYPEFFGGTWSTAPDSVDFRDFTGIDVYRFANAYTDPDGKPIQLVREKGEWTRTIQQYVDQELAKRDHGGQFMSFNAVFSPRGEDGRPMLLFDPKTGAVDRAVAESWKRYDIGHILRTQWPALGPKLQGKLHVFVGTQDTYRLEGACHLLHDDLQRLGSDAQVVFAEGRDHRDLLQPYPELWPDGLLPRIRREMRARFDATHKK